MISSKKRRALINWLANYFPHQHLHGRINYFLTSFLYFTALLFPITIICIISQKFDTVLTFTNNYHKLAIFIILLSRFVLAGIFICMKGNWLRKYCFLQVLGYVSIILFRTLYVMPVLIIEYIAQLAYIISKKQKKGYFDSRLSYQNLFRKSAILKFQVLILNTYTVDNDNRIALLFLILICNFLSTSNSYTDTLYNPHIRQLLIRGQLLIFCFNFYIIGIFSLTSQNNIKPSLSQYIFILICLLIIYYLQEKFTQISFTLSIMSKDPLKLNFREKREYYIEIIKILECLQEFTKNQQKQIFVYHCQQCRETNCIFQAAHTQNYYSLSQSLKKYIIAKLLKCFKTDSYLFNILLYYFHQDCTLNLKQYLSKDSFYQMRQLLQIQQSKQHNDPPNQITATQNLQNEVLQLSKSYMTNLQHLIQQLYEQKINLNKCQVLGKRMIRQKKMLMKINNEQNKPSNSSSSQQIIESENSNLLESKRNSKVNLTIHAQNILNLICSQIFREDVEYDIERNKDEYVDSQSAIVVISLEGFNFGEIISVNQAFLQMFSYYKQQIIGQHFKILLLPEIWEALKNLLDQQVNKNNFEMIDAVIFLMKRDKDLALCNISTECYNEIDGRKIIVRLKQFYANFCLIAASQQCIIMAENKTANLTFSPDSFIGKKFEESFINLFPLASRSVLNIKLETPGPFKIDKIPLHNFPNLPTYYIIKIQLLNSSITKKDSQVLIASVCPPPTFSFSFDLSEVTYTNIMKTSSIFQIVSKGFNRGEQLEPEQWILNQDISQLIYLYGELQFRQNKRLQEMYQCQCHPYSLKMQLSNHKANTLEKKQMQDIQKQQLQNLHGDYVGLYIIGGLFVLLLSFILAFSIILTYQLYTLQKNNLQNNSLIGKRMSLYSKLFIELSSPLWENINSSKISSFLTKFSISDMKQKFIEISKISQQISIIDNIWKYIDFSQYIHQLSQSRQFQQIQQLIEIKIQNLSIITEKQQLSASKIQIFKIIIRQIFPINFYILEQINKQFQKQINSINKYFYILLLVVGLFVLLLAAFTIYLLISKQQQYKVILQSLAYFQQKYLQAYQQKVKGIFSNLLGKGDIVSQESQLFVTGVLNDTELPKKKKTIYKVKFRIFKIIVLPIVVALVIYSIIAFIAYYKFVSVCNLIEMKSFGKIYENSVVEMNIIWINKVLKIYEDNSFVKEYFPVNEPFWNIDEDQFIQTQSYLYTKDLKQRNQANFYSQNFLQQYQSRIMGSLCDNIIFKDEQCSLVVEGYPTPTIFSLRILYNLLLFHNLKQKTNSNTLTTTKYQNSNYAIIKFILYYNEQIGSITSTLQKDQMTQYQEDINILTIIEVIIIIVVIAGAWISVRKTVREVYHARAFVLTLILQLFPLQLLNRNKWIVDWYHEKIIKVKK